MTEVHQPHHEFDGSLVLTSCLSVVSSDKNGINYDTTNDLKDEAYSSPMKTRKRVAPTSSVKFSSVEVIELPMVAGDSHPSHLDYGDDDDDDDEDDYDNPVREKNRKESDSAAITLDWNAQARIKVDLDTYEEEKKKNKKRGRLRRLTRAVRKRILRNIGEETSDIDSEDERVAQKSEKRKKKKKKHKQKGTKKKIKKRLMNRFGRSSHSEKRFVSSSDELMSDGGCPSSTLSLDEKTTPQRISDHAPGLPRRVISPVSTKQKFVMPIPEVSHPKFDDYDEVDPVTGELTMYSSTDEMNDSFSSIKNENWPSHLPSDLPVAPLTETSEHTTRTVRPAQTRRSSMEHVAHAIGTLAKQPAKLAKSTHRRFSKKHSSKSKGMSGSSDDENVLDMSTCSGHRPRSSRELSDDEQDVLLHADEAVHAAVHAEEANLSPRRNRRGSITHAIGTLAKQPVKLAKSTHRKLKKHASKKSRKTGGGVSCSEDEDWAENEMSTNSMPLPPPVFHPTLTESENSKQQLNSSVHDGGAAAPRQARRSSMQHLKSAIGKMAKTPAKLAKSTRRSLRKRVEDGRKSSKDDDDDDDDSIEDSGDVVMSAPGPPPFKGFDSDDEPMIEVESSKIRSPRANLVSPPRIPKRQCSDDYAFPPSIPSRHFSDDSSDDDHVTYTKGRRSPSPELQRPMMRGRRDQFAMPTHEEQSSKRDDLDLEVPHLEDTTEESTTNEEDDQVAATKLQPSIARFLPIENMLLDRRENMGKSKSDVALSKPCRVSRRASWPGNIVLHESEPLTNKSDHGRCPTTWINRMPKVVPIVTPITKIGRFDLPRVPKRSCWTGDIVSGEDFDIDRLLEEGRTFDSMPVNLQSSHSQYHLNKPDRKSVTRYKSWAAPSRPVRVRDDGDFNPHRWL